MALSMKCPCGCTIQYLPENNDKPCPCGMYKLNISIVDNKNVATIVEI
jgi:hypothetical protein